MGVELQRGGRGDGEGAEELRRKMILAQSVLTREQIEEVTSQKKGREPGRGEKQKKEPWSPTALRMLTASLLSHTG